MLTSETPDKEDCTSTCQMCHPVDECMVRMDFHICDTISKQGVEEEVDTWAKIWDGRCKAASCPSGARMFHLVASR